MNAERKKRPRLRLKVLLRIIFSAVFAALVIVLVIIKGSVANSLPSQEVAEKWRAGDMRYAQISCFIDSSSALSDNNIESFRKSIDTALEEASISAETEEARLWIDAYSGRTTVTATSGSKTCEAAAFCVGGDFFYFHELELMDGWYFSDGDLMEDTVIIDRELAWQLFGAFDLEGMSVEINGYPCVISGVSRTPASGAESKTYGTTPAIYIPYRLLTKLGLTVPITCYEAALPDPITDFGKNMIETALALSDGSVKTIQNTNRYSIINSLGSISKYAYSSMRTDGITYPYWENAAIYVQNWCALLTALAIILAVYPVIMLAVVLVKLILIRKLIFRKLSALVKLGVYKIKNRKMIVKT